MLEQLDGFDEVVASSTPDEENNLWQDEPAYSSELRATESMDRNTEAKSDILDPSIDKLRFTDEQCDEILSRFQAGTAELQQAYGQAELIEGNKVTIQYLERPDGTYLIDWGSGWQPVKGTEHTGSNLEQLKDGPLVRISETGNGGSVEVLLQQTKHAGGTLYVCESQVLQLVTHEDTKELNFTDDVSWEATPVFDIALEHEASRAPYSTATEQHRAETHTLEDHHDLFNDLMITRDESHTTEHVDENLISSPAVESVHISAETNQVTAVSESITKPDTLFSPPQSVADPRAALFPRQINESSSVAVTLRHDDVATPIFPEQSPLSVASHTSPKVGKPDAQHDSFYHSSIQPNQVTSEALISSLPRDSYETAIHPPVIPHDTEQVAAIVSDSLTSSINRVNQETSEANRGERFIIPAETSSDLFVLAPHEKSIPFIQEQDVTHGVDQPEARPTTLQVDVVQMADNSQEQLPHSQTIIHENFSKVEIGADTPDGRDVLPPSVSELKGTTEIQHEPLNHERLSTIVSLPEQDQTISQVAVETIVAEVQPSVSRHISQRPQSLKTIGLLEYVDPGTRAALEQAVTTEISHDIYVPGAVDRQGRLQDVTRITISKTGVEYAFYEVPPDVSRELSNMDTKTEPFTPATSEHHLRQDVPETIATQHERETTQAITITLGEPAALPPSSADQRTAPTRHASLSPKRTPLPSFTSGITVDVAPSLEREEQDQRDRRTHTWLDIPITDQRDEQPLVVRRARTKQQQRREG